MSNCNNFPYVRKIPRNGDLVVGGEICGDGVGVVVGGG